MTAFDNAWSLVKDDYPDPEDPLPLPDDLSGEREIDFKHPQPSDCPEAVFSGSWPEWMVEQFFLDNPPTCDECGEEMIRNDPLMGELRMPLGDATRDNQ